MQAGLWGDTLDVDTGGDLGVDQGWDDDDYGDDWNGTTPTGGPGEWCTPPTDTPHPDILAASTLNLCAGPGGWETGAALLPVDLNIIGIDISKDACATAEAAGFKRINTSIRALHPTHYPNLTGLISSTPCPTMSASGLRSGVKTADYQIALDSITSFGAGCGCDWQSLPARSTDVRTALAVETARWALMLPNLRWLVAEQVPAAEYLFEDIAAELNASGWESVNVDTVEAADFGAAARRKRTDGVGTFTASTRRPVSRQVGMAMVCVVRPGAQGGGTRRRSRTACRCRSPGGALPMTNTLQPVRVARSTSSTSKPTTALSVAAARWPPPVRKMISSATRASRWVYQMHTLDLAMPDADADRGERPGFARIRFG